MLTHDPIHGPFTDMELESLQTSLDRAYVAGKVDIEGYLLAYLFMLLGQRPVQYAALKVSDVGVTYAQDGTAVYTIRVPRAKQRNQLSRGEFKDRVTAVRLKREQIQLVVDGDVVGTGVAARKGLLQRHLLEKSD